MKSIYSCYLNIDHVIKPIVLEVLNENNISIEEKDIFNSDFAITNEELNYSFPHIVVKENIEEINSKILFKYDGIGFILSSFDKDLIRISIQNAIYFVMSRGSKGAFKLRIQNELDKINRNGGSFSLAYVSIMDFYKFKNYLSNINIDDTVKEILKMIKVSTRKTDEVMKISRKEFGIMLPNTELRNAEIACERIKRRVSKIKNINFDVNLAFGITQVSDPQESIDEIMERLKKALYISEGNNGEIDFL
ncbi:GGDEF domain-containing protein [Geotoga petraea]|jgi:diguanylate cyclase (GGDEF)-like protein|uniref:Diguanylate cyclase n=1 Tax=Geotoga petraea TaxID=28234 RepID=A0A1G6JH94_9BACT|nr:diguanylate cyclase [Geotoga petraea]TGG88220.1 diguanylate cyclase [Geotoga petraea]SDC18057.1 diguanylate cyclase (GGDEF) domain-containing protein [Geotoga petraea]